MFTHSMAKPSCSGSIPGLGGAHCIAACSVATPFTHPASPSTTIHQQRRICHRYRRHLQDRQHIRVVNAAAGASAAAPVRNGVSLAAVTAGQLLRGTAVDGSQLWLEVVAPAAAGSSCFQAHTQEGELVVVDITRDSITVTPAGCSLDAAAEWVAAFPGWSTLLSQHCNALAAKQGATPRPVLLKSLQYEDSFEELLNRVRQDSRLWCSGTGRDDPPLTELQTATLNAGEIISLLEGKRAVTMVQLWVGWSDGSPQPVFRPFVLRLLRTAALDPRVAVHMSAVPVGAELGLTAILAADTPPYCAWGASLAEFGAQAAIVAQSPYYKLLIGQVLGYELEHIRAHVEASGEKLEPVTIELVEAELQRLSDVEPMLPWWHRRDPEDILQAKAGRYKKGTKAELLPFQSGGDEEGALPKKGFGAAAPAVRSGASKKKRK